MPGVVDAAAAAAAAAVTTAVREYMRCICLPHTSTVCIVDEYISAAHNTHMADPDSICSPARLYVCLCGACIHLTGSRFFAFAFRITKRNDDGKLIEKGSAAVAFDGIGCVAVAATKNKEETAAKKTPPF